MIRTVIRRVGILAAATVLTGVGVAGAAVADTGHGKEPKKPGEVTTVTGFGGYGSGGDVNNQCVLPVNLGNLDLLSNLIPIASQDNDTNYNSQCSPVGGAGHGGAGIGE